MYAQNAVAVNEFFGHSWNKVRRKQMSQALFFLHYFSIYHGPSLTICSIMYRLSIQRSAMTHSVFKSSSLAGSFLIRTGIGSAWVLCLDTSCCSTSFSFCFLSGSNVSFNPFDEKYPPPIKFISFYILKFLWDACSPWEGSGCYI